MKTMTSCLLAAALVGAGHGAEAMTLNPRGTGQVLLYPYYTVNNHQQTLLSIVNATSAGKAVRVRLREAYNGRDVLNFNVFLAPNDTWTAIVFALDDAGVPGNGAALAVDDRSCTYPVFSTSPTVLPDGRHYQPLLALDYTGDYADTGPSDDARTREGFIEVFEMAELNSTALAEVRPPPDGSPPHCSTFAIENSIVSNPVPPGGSLYGAASIVNVSQGTFYGVNATAIDGFFSKSAYSASGSTTPSLADATPDANGFVTAHVPIGGSVQALKYSANQAIDAVSALLTAEHVLGEFDISAALGAHTDWVLTFPTKQYYVDPRYDVQAPVPPFENVFGTPTPGRSDTFFYVQGWDRAGQVITDVVQSSGDIDPHPAGPPILSAAYETQVVTFSTIAQQPQPVSSVLGSRLTATAPLADALAGTGELVWAGPFSASAQLRPDAALHFLRGRPVIGFAAVDYVNANVTQGVLANYSAAYPLRSTVSCFDSTANNACE